MRRATLAPSVRSHESEDAGAAAGGAGGGCVAGPHQSGATEQATGEGPAPEDTGAAVLSQVRDLVKACGEVIARIDAAKPRAVRSFVYEALPAVSADGASCAFQVKAVPAETTVGERVAGWRCGQPMVACIACTMVRMGSIMSIWRW